MLIAGITIVISAVLAFVQNDIKKVLAYSTVGQLGYMMLGLGAGAWLPAVFHIFTHAFFKCALFLCAGSVSHSGSHHSFDMKQDMGGLAKKMPITATCWIICGLALAGVFPLSGFFSKDEIIDNVGHNGYTAFMWIALGGAFLTAAYTVRATYLTFFGHPRGAAAYTGHEDAHAIEAEAAAGAELEAHDARGLGVYQEGELEESAAHGQAGSVAVALEEHDGGDDAHGAHGHDDHAHGEHHPPRESGKLILVPIVILTFCAALAGFTNAVPFGEDWEQFKKHVEGRPEAVELDEGGEAAVDEADTGLRRVVIAVGADEGGEGEEAAAGEEEGHGAGCGYEGPEEGTVCYFPAISHAEFEWSKAAVSLIVVGRRPDLQLDRLRRPLHPPQPPSRRADRAPRSRPVGLPLRRQQVLPRRPLRRRHRPADRPPDRPGLQLDQPERHRRRRQRRRLVRPQARWAAVPGHRPGRRRRRRQRVRRRRHRHRHGPAPDAVRQGQPVRRPAVRCGGRRRRRPRDRQRVRL